MSARRLWELARGMRQLRHTPDLVALRAAGSPDELARLALIPAGRNLGIAIISLPADLRAEATAALLACRVLDAYEDLSTCDQAGTGVLAAVRYLTGATETPPPPLHAVTHRDSEAVDLLLAERIHDIRALLSALPPLGRERAGLMLADVADVMARNIDVPLPRAAYAEGVLGRAVQYACALVTEDSGTESSLVEFAGCIGVVAQMANDLRDNELELYGAHDHDELLRVIMLRLLAPAIGGFALLSHLGPRTPSLGARTAIAYMAVTTAAFLCNAVDAPSPYRRGHRLGAALLAAGSPALWAGMLSRIHQCADSAIRQILDTSPSVFGRPEIVHENATSIPLGHLIVDTTFGLVRNLPDETLLGELPDSEVRAMMLADHLAFGALDQLGTHDVDAIRSVAAKFQLMALDTTTSGQRS